jgi:hypothetical protein
MNAYVYIHKTVKMSNQFHYLKQFILGKPLKNLAFLLVFTRKEVLTSTESQKYCLKLPFDILQITVIHLQISASVAHTLWKTALVPHPMVSPMAVDPVPSSVIALQVLLTVHCIVTVLSKAVVLVQFTNQMPAQHLECLQVHPRAQQDSKPVQAHC